MKPIFDAHLDLAWNALSFNRDLTLPVDTLREYEKPMQDHSCRAKATLTFPEMKKAHLYCFLGTLLARVNSDAYPAKGFSRTDLDYAHPSIAYAVARGQLAWYRLLEQQGVLRCITTAEQLRQHHEQWQNDPSKTPFGMILSMEGADPITHPDQCRTWFDQGLRVASLVHYGQRIYAGGSGSDSPLTPAGIDLLKAFERTGMILDITHLCDKSFDDALDRFTGPVIASHHNCRAIVNHWRQLDDRQIKRLIDRHAVIGSALDGWMIKPGWNASEPSTDDISLADLADHIDHICQLTGNTQHVALGTDLDGGFGAEQTPRDLDRYTDLHKLEEILTDRGYSENDLDNFFYQNWQNFFLKHLPQ